MARKACEKWSAAHAKSRWIRGGQRGSGRAAALALWAEWQAQRRGIHPVGGADGAAGAGGGVSANGAPPLAHTRGKQHLEKGQHPVPERDRLVEGLIRWAAHVQAHLEEKVRLEPNILARHQGARVYDLPQVKY